MLHLKTPHYVKSIAFLAAASVASHAATFEPGYVQGASSQLLTGNGGAGSILFVDGAMAGGENDLDGSFPAFQSGFLDGTTLWNLGDTVEITGVAFTVRGNTTSGTFTFDILQGAGGSGATGAGGLSSLGTATATFTDQASSVVAYANFDTPVSFVVDANSTSIGMQFSTTSSTLGWKAWNNDTTNNRSQRYNVNNGAVPGGSAQWFAMSLAGNVTPVPEPSTYAALVGAAVMVFTLIRRRRA